LSYIKKSHLIIEAQQALALASDRWLTKTRNRSMHPFFQQIQQLAQKVQQAQTG
jgi:hypothetical protein